MKDKINNYVNSMFMNLPKTKEAIEIKQNIIENMEDKFDELVASGVSEEEAFNQVKKQFGNIDEIKSSLGIDKNENSNKCEEKNKHFHSRDNEEDESSIKVTKIQDSIIGIIMLTFCVSYFILGYFGYWHPGWIVFPIGGIICGIIKKLFKLHNAKKNKNVNLKVVQGLISGIIMMVIVIIYLLLGFLKGTWYTWWLLFVVGGILCAIVNLILIITKKDKKIKDITSSIDGIIMLIALCVFFIFGMYKSMWNPMWIVFPIGGILCGICSIVGEIAQGKEDKKND